MGERAVNTITRTVTVSDLTPTEAASIFAEWDAVKQAAFFSAIHHEAKDWPGTGWCGQAMHIAEAMDHPGRQIVKKLAEWIDA